MMGFHMWKMISSRLLMEIPCARVWHVDFLQVYECSIVFFFALSLSCQYPGPRIMIKPVGCVFAYWDVRTNDLERFFPLHVPSPSIGSLHTSLISYGIASNLQKWLFSYSLDGLVIILVQFSSHQTNQDLYSHEAIFWMGIDFPMIYILIFHPIVVKNYSPEN